MDGDLADRTVADGDVAVDDVSLRTAFRMSSVSYADELNSAQIL